MTEALDTLSKLDDCSLALNEWMKSQELLPADGVMLAAWFTARMIVDNAPTTFDIERKIELNTNTIRQFIHVIRQLGFKP